jgi:hypothetical protein
MHAVVAWVRTGQTLPHTPQFATSAPVSVSHPSVAPPVQSDQPSAQPPTLHTPPAQPASACGGAGQTWPHVAQFRGSICGSDSHPSAATSLQSSHPVSHETTVHTADAQPVVA